MKLIRSAKWAIDTEDDIYQILEMALQKVQEFSFIVELVPREAPDVAKTVEPARNAPNDHRRRKRRKRRGPRSELSGTEVIMKELQDGRKKSSYLSKAFLANGLSDNGVSACLGTLRKSGKVIRCMPGGIYALSKNEPGLEDWKGEYQLPLFGRDK
jgi:hypothetical protein